MCEIICEKCNKKEQVAEQFKSNKLCRDCYLKEKNGVEKMEKKDFSGVKLEAEGIVNQQTKISIEMKLSRNFNTVTFGIQDEPILSSTEKEFREGIKAKAKILRETAEEELKLINSVR